MISNLVDRAQSPPGHSIVPIVVELSC